VDHIPTLLFLSSLVISFSTIHSPTTTASTSFIRLLVAKVVGVCLGVFHLLQPKSFAIINLLPFNMVLDVIHVEMFHDQIVHLSMDTRVNEHIDPFTNGAKDHNLEKPTDRKVFSVDSFVIAGMILHVVHY
jgi:hypothetical protein